jgi:hypothetical protein
MSGITAAMQPYFFPYIGYFQLMHAAPKLLLHDQLQYIRRGFMHRNSYLQPGSGAKYFGVELDGKTTGGGIEQVRLSSSSKWRDSVISRLDSAYKKAPFYDDVMPIVVEVLNLETDYLAALNIESIRAVKTYLDLPCSLTVVSIDWGDLEETLANRVANSEDSGIDIKHQRIIEICRMTDAHRFINPIGGSAIYDRELLAQHGVDIRFLRSRIPEYQQRHSTEFVPNLSILDALFHCSRDQLASQIADYELC